MLKWKFPRIMAMVGLMLGGLAILIHWYIYVFNPFNLPNYKDLQGVSSYSAPPLYFFIERSLLAICPGQLIHFFFIDCTGASLWAVWGAGAILNAVLYFGIGCGLSALWGRWKS